MEALVCERCGASAFWERDGVRICQYCDTRYKILRPEEEKAPSGISLAADIENLLEKCYREPENAKRYAGIILDIDPDNEEAARFFRT